MTKAEIVRRAAELGLDFALTSSCYDPGPDGEPCGALRLLPSPREGLSRRPGSPIPTRGLVNT